MKESIGYSVTINIIITFIIIIFAFLAAAIIYFKTNKASNILVDTIQKYEGYNITAKNEITMKLNGLGYGSHSINCDETIVGKSPWLTSVETVCSFRDPEGLTANQPNRGFCVYRCKDQGIDDYYYYKVRINMMINVPIVGNLLDIPIYKDTDRMYDFENNLKVQ